jgi:hypothetical protein
MNEFSNVSLKNLVQVYSMKQFFQVHDSEREVVVHNIRLDGYVLMQEFSKYCIKNNPSFMK